MPDSGGQGQTATEPSNEDWSTGYVRRLNEIIFRLLYREPVDLSTFGSKSSPARVVRDLAQLAARYGCIRYVQGELVSLIVTSGGIGGDLIRREACLLMETACLLKNEAIFVDALRHAVGRRAALAKEMPSVPAEIAELVEHHTGLLRAKIRAVCRALVGPPWRVLTSPLSSHGVSFTRTWSPTSSTKIPRAPNCSDR